MLFRQMFLCLQVVRYYFLPLNSPVSNWNVVCGHLQTMFEFLEKKGIFNRVNAGTFEGFGDTLRKLMY